MNLTELAKTPVAFDTELARLHGELAKAQAALQAKMDTGHRAVGDKRHSTRFGIAWDKSWSVVHAELLESADSGDQAHRALIDSFYAAQAAWREIENQIQAMDRAYTGWTRFFPSVTKSQPHIHRSLSCHTLHPTTVMRWAPQLSGTSDEQAVADLDEALCSVCFPDAPVALHNYQSKRSQAERDARQVEKDARDAIKARKQLTADEQFRTTYLFHDRVTTVAKCLELVRKAVELEVEHEYWTQVAAGTRSVPQGWTPEHLARRVSNGADSLSQARVDAAEAKRVLLAREARHEGYGATEAAIAKVEATKLKSARKDWM